MAKVQKAIVDFTKKRDAAIIPECEFIIESMTDNTSFPTTTPALTVVQDVLDSFSQALSEAASRDRNKVAIKNQLRRQLNSLLNQLGNYVNTQSKGDVTMIVSSGFTLTKLPQPRYLSVPTNLTVQPGFNPGSLVSKVKADKAATGYIHMISPSPTGESMWTSVSTSRSQYEFTGLEQGKEYLVKVAAVGTNDQIVYSTIVSRFAA